MGLIIAQKMNISANTYNQKQCKKSFFESKVRQILAEADIEINGSKPWDIQVLAPAFYKHVLIHGSLGLGEAYIYGWWNSEKINETITKVLRASITTRYNFLTDTLTSLQAKLINLQTKSRAFHVGKHHYDISNNLYEKMLDKHLAYTCGYWARANTLEQAQEDKLDLICRKLDLKAGMKVLDIGCGWGSLAKYAAENYAVEVVGITISKEQVALARERCKGLPIEIRLQDYRDVNEQFDTIASIGMFEHVGHKNYADFIQVVQRCLKEGSRFLLHTIGKNISTMGVDPWVAKYIFPNGEIPSLKQIFTAVEQSSMIIEDVHNFGPDYEKTLLCWFDNFHQAWPELKDQYSEKFYRIWKYYLLMCAGAFNARHLQLWQIVMSKGYPQASYRRPE